MVVVGLKRPEREDDRRSRWSSLGGAVLVRSTRAGTSHGLTDHLPARRGLLDRVRLERAGAHRDPRLHGRAMSALRPAPGGRTLTSGRRAIKRSAGTAWPNGAPHARKRRPRKPLPRPLGWHLGAVSLAQADQVGGDGAPQAVSRRVGAVRTSGRRGADRLVHTSRKLNWSGVQRRSVAGELALAVGQRPLDLAQASAVPLASWLAAMSASRVTSRVAGWNRPVSQPSRWGSRSASRR
jgi:hypothetical protein